MTRSFESIHEILDFAIAREAETHAFYTDLSRTMKDPAMKQAFLEFGAEELQHKANLEAIKAGEYGLIDNSLPLPRMAIAEALQDVTPSSEMDYAAVLTFAMKREKAAYLLYLRLASEAKNKPLAEVFLTLAHQEANHKLRFEIEYDDVVLREN